MVINLSTELFWNDIPALEMEVKAMRVSFVNANSIMLT